MSKLIIITILLVAVCVLLLCIGMIVKKNGSFPKNHVSQNPEMRRRGVHCAQSQDYEQRHKRPRIAEVSR